MSIFFADKETCTKCGACIIGCPRLIIQKDDEGFPFVLPKDEYYCMHCSHCVVNCAYNAAHLGDFGMENATNVNNARFPNPDESRFLLCSRRSVRKFKPDPVSRETLKDIFDIARYAPSASNLQTVRWIVLENKPLQAFKQLYLQRANEGKTSPGRYSRQDDQQIHGKDPVFRGAPLLVVALLPNSAPFKEDAAIAITYLELAAHSLGVGTMWSGVSMRFLRNDQTARTLLKIADDEYIGGAMLLGFARLPLSRLLPNKNEPHITWLV